MTDLRSEFSLQHHLSDGGGDGFSRAVVPDELGVLVRSLEYVHRGLWVITHGVHEHGRQEAHQGQTHLRERRNTGDGVIKLAVPKQRFSNSTYTV